MFPKRLYITVLSGLIIIAGSLLAIQFAKGYRPSREGTVKGTGLLAANSFPNGAQVFINGELATATDNTVNKDPGEYQVEIRKDGFHPWQKNLRIEKELVTQTNALLLPVAPSLSPLSFNGVSGVHPSPDGQRLAFVVASASATTKNGVYILDLSDTLLSLQKGPKQIIKVSNASEARELAQAAFLWAPDNSSIMIKANGRTFLADPDQLQSRSELSDTTPAADTLLAEWTEEFEKRRGIKLRKFPLRIQEIATSSASSYYISPDENMILYTATASASLPDRLLETEIQAASTQPQSRTIRTGATYVYDLREDRNFEIGYDARLTAPSPTSSPLPMRKNGTGAKSKTPTVAQTEPTLRDSMRELSLAYSPSLIAGWQWHPDSRHVMGIEGNSVVIKEYDAQNAVAVYAGPRGSDFTYPWSNGSKLVILANFTPDANAAPNLYAVSLK